MGDLVCVCVCVLLFLSTVDVVSIVGDLCRFSWVRLLFSVYVSECLTLVDQRC